MCVSYVIGRNGGYIIGEFSGVYIFGRYFLFILNIVLVFFIFFIMNGEYIVMIFYGF